MPTPPKRYKNELTQFGNETNFYDPKDIVAYFEYTLDLRYGLTHQGDDRNNPKNPQKLANGRKQFSELLQRINTPIQVPTYTQYGIVQTYMRAPNSNEIFRRAVSILLQSKYDPYRELSYEDFENHPDIKAMRKIWDDRQEYLLSKPEAAVAEPIAPIAEPVASVAEPVAPVAEPVAPVAEPVAPEPIDINDLAARREPPQAPEKQTSEQAAPKKPRKNIVRNTAITGGITGALVGLLIGALIGGPIGMAIGVAVGLTFGTVVGAGIAYQLKKPATSIAEPTTKTAKESVDSPEVTDAPKPTLKTKGKKVISKMLNPQFKAFSRSKAEKPKPTATDEPPTDKPRNHGGGHP